VAEGGGSNTVVIIGILILIVVVIGVGAYIHHTRSMRQKAIHGGGSELGSVN